MKKEFYLTTMFFVCLLFVIQACKKENLETKFPPETDCDTSAITFAQSVLPIMAAKCNMCHAQGSSSGAGIVLSDYTGVKQQVDNNRLLGSIIHASGFSPMPKGGGKLNECEILLIDTWIKAGAINN